jgi:hypothetical protein
MSIAKYISIVCDEMRTDDCLQFSEGATTTALARRDAKEQGWKTIDGFDCCPNCVKDLNNAL